MKKAWQCIWYQIKQDAKINKWQIPLQILSGLMDEAQKMVSMFLPATVLNLLLAPDKTSAALIVVTASNLVIVIFSFLTEYGGRTLCLHGIRFTNTMQLNMNRKTMRMNYAETERSDSMERYDAASDGIWNSCDITYYIFRVIFSRLVLIAVTFYVFARVHILVALVVLSTIALEFWINMWNDKKQHANDRETATYKQRQSYLDSTLYDPKVLRDMVFNDAKSFLLKKRSGLMGQILKVVGRNQTLDFFEESLSALFALIRTPLIYLLAMRQYSNGKLLLSEFLLFISAAQQMTWALFQMANAASYVRKAVRYCNDYLQYMDMPETDRTEGNRSVPKSTHTLEFRNVSFRYTNGADDVLRNVSFSIKSNETVAIVGDNGAGKSTLVKLLLRLYKVSSGDILLDGVSIYDYRYDDYMALFAPVFQDFKLYSFTLGENLCFGNEADKSGIYEALKNVGLLEKISSLPRELDTPYTKRFEEDGIVFSGGEEQKLAIARAFVKSSATSMILDEPTASLDPLTEYEINKLILRAAAKDFLIFISHRLSTTRFADKIIVLENGAIVEEGRHDKLISKTGGKYQAMYAMQSSYYQSAQQSDIK